MFAGFSFGATVRVFGGAFAATFVGAFLFAGMAAGRIFGLEAGLEMERRVREMRGGGDGVLVEKTYTFGMCQPKKFRLARRRRVRVLREGAGTGLLAFLLDSEKRR
jgi:hypothetical protein